MPWPIFGEHSRPRLVGTVALLKARSHAAAAHTLCDRCIALCGTGKSTVLQWILDPSHPLPRWSMCRRSSPPQAPPGWQTAATCTGTADISCCLQLANNGTRLCHSCCGERAHV
jgi:hypothetical protein